MVAGSGNFWNWEMLLRNIAVKIVEHDYVSGCSLEAKEMDQKFRKSHRLQFTRSIQRWQSGEEFWNQNVLRQCNSFSSWGERRKTRTQIHRLLPIITIIIIRRNSLTRCIKSYPSSVCRSLRPNPQVFMYLWRSQTTVQLLHLICSELYIYVHCFFVKIWRPGWFIVMPVIVMLMHTFYWNTCFSFGLHNHFF